MRKPASYARENLGTGRRDTSSKSEKLGPNDPRWRREAQAAATKPVIASGLEYDANDRLSVKPLRGVDDATSANLVDTVNKILTFLRR